MSRKYHAESVGASVSSPDEAIKAARVLGPTVNVFCFGKTTLTRRQVDVADVAVIVRGHQWETAYIEKAA